MCTCVPVRGRVLGVSCLCDTARVCGRCVIACGASAAALVPGLRVCVGRGLRYVAGACAHPRSAGARWMYFPTPARSYRRLPPPRDRDRDRARATSAGRPSSRARVWKTAELGRAAFVRGAASSLQPGWPRGLPRALRVPGIGPPGSARAPPPGPPGLELGQRVGTLGPPAPPPRRLRPPRAQIQPLGPLAAQGGAPNAPSRTPQFLLTVFCCGVGGVVGCPRVVIVLFVLT